MIKLGITIRHGTNFHLRFREKSVCGDHYYNLCPNFLLRSCCAIGLCDLCFNQGWPLAVPVHFVFLLVLFAF
ncbi:hypothetical protein OIU77_015461, partial [Salix suchowensis]